MVLLTNGALDAQPAVRRATDRSSSQAERAGEVVAARTGVDGRGRWCDTGCSLRARPRLMIDGLMELGDLQLAAEYGAAHGALAMTTPGDNSTATLAEVEALVRGGGARVRR